MFQPEADQQVVIDACANDESDALLLAGELGTGKTVTAVEVMKVRSAQRVLVILPKNTRGFHKPGHATEYDGWIGTLRRQGYDGPIVKAEKRSDILDNDGPVVMLIGREFVHLCQKETKTEAGIDWAKVEPFDMVIYDECHRVSNRKSEAFATVKRIRTDYKVGLSATPAGNRFDGMWAVCRWLWPTHTDIIPRSYWSWRYDWCREEEVYVARDETRKVVVGEKVPGEFVKTLPNYHRMERKRMAQFSRMYVELGSRQRKVYDQMARDMLAWLDDNPLVAKLPIVKRIRLREISLAVPSLTEDDEVFFEPNAQSAAIDSVKEFLGGVDGGVLMLTHSKRFATMAAKRLGAELWTGDTPDHERDRIKAEFMAGRVTRILATIEAIAEGVDGLQHRGRTVIFFSRSDNRLMNEQVIGRFDRRGQEEPVDVIDVIPVDTFSEMSLDAQENAGVEYLRSLRKEN